MASIVEFHDPARNGWAGVNDVPAELVRERLARTLGSGTCARAERMKLFLQFVVPGRLRWKLAEYYKTSGLRSIAVLPLVDLSPESAYEYFCDGLTEEIIQALARVAPLRVVSRTSVMQFKGVARDIRRIGSQLNVNAVLEGSVRIAGTRARVTVGLLNVADGCHLWADTTDYTVEDILATQERIARSVVDVLRTRLVQPPLGPAGNGTAPDTRHDNEKDQCTLDLLIAQVHRIAPPSCCRHGESPCLSCGLEWLVRNGVSVPLSVS